MTSHRVNGGLPPGRETPSGGTGGTGGTGGPPGTSPGQGPEGALAAILQRIEGRRRSNGGLAVDRVLVDQLATEVGGIAAEFRRRVHDGGTRAESLAATLAPNSPMSGYADPVVRMTLADLAGFDTLCEVWFPRALAAYPKNVGVYDNVLEGWIPADLTSLARAELERQQYKSGTNVTAACDWPVFLQERRMRREDPSHKVTTGLPGLDRMLGGGLPGGLTMLGGGTNVGKSSLAVSIVLNTLRADSGLAAVVVELDMRKESIYEMVLRATNPGGRICRPPRIRPPGWTGCACWTRGACRRSTRKAGMSTTWPSG